MPSQLGLEHAGQLAGHAAAQLHEDGVSVLVLRIRIRGKEWPTKSPRRPRTSSSGSCPTSAHALTLAHLGPTCARLRFDHPGDCDSVRCRARSRGRQRPRVIRPEAWIDRARVRPDRVGRQKQLGCDLSRRQIGRQQPQHRELRLAWRLEQSAAARLTLGLGQFGLDPRGESRDRAAVTELRDRVLRQTERHPRFIEAPAPTADVGQPNEHPGVMHVRSRRGRTALRTRTDAPPRRDRRHPTVRRRPRRPPIAPSQLLLLVILPTISRAASAWARADASQPWSAAISARIDRAPTCPGAPEGRSGCSSARVAAPTPRRTGRRSTTPGRGSRAPRRSLVSASLGELNRPVRSIASPTPASIASARTIAIAPPARRRNDPDASTSPGSRAQAAASLERRATTRIAAVAAASASVRALDDAVVRERARPVQERARPPASDQGVTRFAEQRGDGFLIPRRGGVLGSFDEQPS